MLYKGSRPDSLTAIASDKKGTYGCKCSDVNDVIDPRFEYVGAVPSGVIRTMLTVVLSRSGVDL